jgi:hypothetical protein
LYNFLKPWFIQKSISKLIFHFSFLFRIRPSWPSPPPPFPLPLWLIGQPALPALPPSSFLLPSPSRHRPPPGRRCAATPRYLPVCPLSSPKQMLPLPFPLHSSLPPSLLQGQMAGVMAPLGHHHRHTVWPPPHPPAPIKGCPGRASPRRTPHRPPFLLSGTGAGPHCEASATATSHRHPAASSPPDLR